MRPDSGRIRLVLDLRKGGITETRVLAAMEKVPREIFVPEAFRDRAYDSTALLIGHHQTVSGPLVVAQMTQALEVGARHKVLEIGTGSGYQAAVLAHFTRHVYSIEIVKPLAKSGKARLKRLGYTVVEARAGDGYHGWAEKGPFDAIIVTCAAGRIPPPLIRQLAPGGRMVIPVGRPGTVQWLTLVEKRLDGSIRTKTGMGVSFVPMTGRAGKK
jgi:protein-L-isoaspartate(D-aspartate) O-methyltransferase